MKRLFAIIQILFFCLCLHAQDRLWDAALDQYQQICDECISIRSRAAAGESVQMASMTQLLSRLSSLRKTLKDAEGQMTPAQRLRYESIRMRYEEVFGARRHDFSLPAMSMQSGFAEPLHLVSLAPEEYIVPIPNRPELIPAGQPQFGIILYTGVPDMYYGTMLRLSFAGKPVGAFAKASLSLPYIRGAYECQSDGTTEGGYIWTSGDETLSRWSATAGITVTPLPLLTFYAGGGYGTRSVLWKDVAGRWATVSDRSCSGLSADAGVIFNLNRFCLMAGVSTIGFSNFSAEFGAGISF